MDIQSHASPNFRKPNNAWPSKTRPAKKNGRRHRYQQEEDQKSQREIMGSIIGHRNDPLEKAKEMRATSVFAARFSDLSIRCIVIDKTPKELGYKIDKGGRRDCGDKYDREDCAYIPMGDFAPLAEMPNPALLMGRAQKRTRE